MMIPIASRSTKHLPSDLLIETVKKGAPKLDFKAFIKEWNSSYSYDRWWRRKYNIPFGSEQHLNASHVFMALEYKEDKFFEDLKDVKHEFETKDKTIATAAGIGTVISEKREIKLKGKQLDAEFFNLDLNQFNDNGE